MNYQKIYNYLIERAKTRNKEDLTEFLNVHHIIPKHSWGTNDENNLVVLTYKEHIFAHKLLFKIYTNYLDQYAYLLMSSKTEEAMHELKKLKNFMVQKYNLLEEKWVVKYLEKWMLKVDTFKN